MGGMTFHADEYKAAAGRYRAGMPYRRVGRSGLDLPAVSLGLWHNFGDDVPLERQQATLRRAFDRGVTHFDLANNYGPPYGWPSATSAPSSPATSGPTATSWSSAPRPATTCGRAPTARAAARGSTSSPRATSR